MASRQRLLRLGGGIAASVVAVAATIVAITLSAGPALAAGTGTGYLRTNGNRIVDATGATVRLTGINWFGMETDNRTFHGLWANAPATWRGQIDRMASLGFNTLRVPYAREAVQPGATATSINTFTNPDLVGLSPLQILDGVINYAGSKGMRVILDRHRPTSAGQTPLWYTPAVSEASMIADWVMLANRYAGNTTVIGADLFNEPHAEGQYPNGTGACWGCGDTARDWRLAAQRIGNAVLAANSNWLIFVEGVSCINGAERNNPPTESCDWWGGNLSQAIAQPVQLNVANRLVYAPHDYAISVFDRQDWFDDPSFPNNLPGVWDNFWGNIAKQNVAPIMLGEFGSTLANPLDVQWLNTLMNYLTTNGMSFTYWSWNPNSGDTGGIALDDWYSVNQQKMNILSPHLVAPVPPGGTTTTPPPLPGTPGTPTTSNVTSTSVTLSWTASSGTVANYQVERCTGATCTNFANVGNPPSNSFTNGSLTASTTYRYRVRAANATGNSGYSGITNVTTSSTTTVPGTPGTLTCTVASPTSVSLTWGASTGATSYQIERATGATSTTFSQVGTSTTTSFTNTGLTTGTTYRYQVRGANSAGVSQPTGIVNCTPVNTGSVPGTPGTPTASGVTASAASLSWTASTGTVTSYQVERCAGSTCTTFANVGNPTTNSFADSGLTASTTYRYRVRAVNSVGNSAYSGITNVTTTGGTTGGCSATLTLQTGWGGGYVMQPVTVTNNGTSAINGWTVTFTLPAGHAITNSWNATVTISGQTVTARGISGQNASLGAGASTNWGFQATRPTSDNSVPSSPTCTSP